MPARSRGSLAANRRRTQGWAAWLLALPFVVVFAAFMLLPIAGSLAMSFTDMTVRDVGTPFAVNLIGFDQYAALFADPLFVQSLGNTAAFVLVCIPITMAIALAMAVALDAGIERLRTVFRVGFFAPVVTAVVAIAIVWRFILQPDGLLNAALAVVGIEGPDWLSDPAWALPAMILMTVWRNFGLLVIIFLAGLQAVPPELHEAAAVDGAGAGARFRRITLPILTPTLLLGGVLLSVSYLQFFEEPFVMTGGGPLGSTTSVSLFVYNQFGFGDYAFGAAGAYVLFVIIAAVSAAWFRLLRSRE
ncbi:sugar ABC transporter permease [Microbacterium sp. 2FI]|uniref:carbohydrate ABC transporter permease n=1 Tax=Microbacterium sp. 2FI TaxID=2502193 RepID=UPI002017E3C2|nr:sugar ABC transporter permease [Microbacterium sp. 2FI]